MRVVQIPNGAFVENSYLVIDEAAAECAVIDPGEEAGLILREIAAAGTRATAIWITHAHLDHVMGVLRVRQETAAPVYLHPADRELYDHAVQQGLAFGVAVDPPPPPHPPPAPRGTGQGGGVRVTGRPAPGRSPGGGWLVGGGGGVSGGGVVARAVGRAGLP